MSSFDKYPTAEERGLAIELLTAALAAGLLVSVSDGDEWTLKRSGDLETIKGELATTDHNVLRFWHADGTREGIAVLIWGNGCDLVSDWSDTELLGEIITPIISRH
jgi:hypothetical protein